MKNKLTTENKVDCRKKIKTHKGVKSFSLFFSFLSLPRPLSTFVGVGVGGANKIVCFVLYKMVQNSVVLCQNSVTLCRSISKKKKKKEKKD